MECVALDYRKDLDGLRGIGVVAIILFHLEFSWIKGGFIALDLFFVLSGYLITKIIKSKIEDNSFSFKEFYARRIRRLFPALFVVVSLTLLAGLVLLEPQRLIQLSKMAVSSLFYYSNIYFWQNTGYFTWTGKTSLLTHTWSLSLEEQFYILWPVFVLFLSRIKNGSYFFQSLAIVTCVSLFSLIYVGEQYRDATYFLLPFRIFEFTTGALIVWVEKFRLNEKKITPIVATISFTILFFSFWFFKSFYDWYHLPTIVGVVCTAAIILFHSSFLSKVILENNLSIWLGRISYSLYLVHWPIIVFYKLYNRDLSDVEKVSLFAASVVLADFICRYVEKPIRFSKKRSLINRPSYTFGLATALSLLIVIFHFAVTENDGLPSRAESFAEKIYLQQRGKRRPEVSYQNYCIVSRNENIDRCKNFDDKRGSILLYGDSHMLDLAEEFHRRERDKNILIFAKGGCNPLIKSNCDFVRKEFIRFSKLYKSSINAIFLHFFVGSQTDKLATGGKVIFDSLLENQLQRKTVVIGYRKITLKHAFDTLLHSSSIEDYVRTLRSSENMWVHWKLDDLREYVSDKGFAYIDFQEAQTKNGKLRVLTDTGEPYYRDRHHLTKAGAKQFMDYLQVQDAYKKALSSSMDPVIAH